MQIDGEGEPDAIPAAGKSAVKSNDGVNESPLLRLDNITKYFHELCANDSVSLDVYPGQIHALLGENGAGKSTLVKIILGALRPDGGRAYWQGAPLAPSSPADARQLGIGMVFQHFSLFESLTVFENLALTLPKNQQRNRRELSNTIRETAQSYGLHINLDAIVGGISAGERQRVEIIRCLIQHPKLIIMDEPTSVLTPQEAEHLFEVLRRLAAEGTSVLYISHRLDEVRQLCSWATILRQGKVVTRCDPRQETPQSLAQKMVGSEVVDPTRPANIQKTVRLHIDNLSYQRQTEHGVSLNNISLVVLAGEIVGIAGIAGNGQSELFDCLSGEKVAPKSTSINFDDKDVGALGVNARRKLGAVFVPEERHGHSAAADLALEKNCLLTRHATGEDFIKRGAIDKPLLQKVTARIIGEYDVRFHGHNPPARALSGGNLQKFVLGRELDRNPGIVIVNQPSWGVDAGVAALIRQKLIDLAASGSAILMISQDLDEILMISNRIAVISRGILSEALPSDTVNREIIGLMMASGNMSGGVGAAGASPNSASHPAANLSN